MRNRGGRLTTSFAAWLDRNYGLTFAACRQRLAVWQRDALVAAWLRQAPEFRRPRVNTGLLYCKERS